MWRNNHLFGASASISPHYYQHQNVYLHLCNTMQRFVSISSSLHQLQQQVDASLSSIHSLFEVLRFPPPPHPSSLPRVNSYDYNVFDREFYYPPPPPPRQPPSHTRPNYQPRRRTTPIYVPYSARAGATAPTSSSSQRHSPSSPLPRPAPEKKQRTAAPPPSTSASSAPTSAATTSPSSSIS